MKKEPAEKG